MSTFEQGPDVSLAATPAHLGPESVREILGNAAQICEGILAAMDAPRHEVAGDVAAVARLLRAALKKLDAGVASGGTGEQI